MCHMIADSEDLLHDMAAKIGVDRKWYQGDHYDICSSKRKLAVKFGAVEITFRQAGAMNSRRKSTGALGAPEDAESWLLASFKARRAAQRGLTPAGPSESVTANNTKEFSCRT